MLKVAEAENIALLALPRIGAGLGGLAWDDVKATIVKVAANVRLRVWVCEEFVAGQPLK